MLFWWALPTLRGSMNKTIWFLIILFFCLMVVEPSSINAEDYRLSSPDTISGYIYINIKGGRSKYYDLSFSPSDNILHKINEGRIVKEEKNGRSLDILSGSDYLKIREASRGLQDMSDNKYLFNLIFGEYDLSSLDNMYQRKEMRCKICDRKKTFYLKKAKHNTQETIFPSDFIINEKKTHAVYNPGYSNSFLIDLRNMEVSTAFCNDDIDDIVWDKTGQYVAYASSGSETRSTKFILMVIDVTSSTLKFIKATDTDRTIEDIAWIPSSEYIAILSSTSRWGLWPWELLLAFSGHPVPHDTFYLSIYDIKGNELLTKEIISNVAYGWGTLVWVSAADKGL